MAYDALGNYYDDGSTDFATELEKKNRAVSTGQVPPAAQQTGGTATTFNRMVQAESNGQQFNQQGGVLTSPKGAQGMAQIMPATAANPGFGLKPLSPEDLADPVKNRQFGEEYYNALLRHFNGDEQKAVAAYNMGPGAVQKNIQANQGQFNVSQAPKETQGYLGKVLGAINPISSAQAGELTPEQRGTVSPQAPAQVTAPGQYRNMAGQGTVAYNKPFNLDEEINASGSDLNKLASLLNKTQDPAERDLIFSRLADTQYAQRKVDQAKQQATNIIQTGDYKALNAALKDKSEEGSWLQFAFKALLGLPDYDNAARLGLSGKMATVIDYDGKPYKVLQSQSGTPIRVMTPDGRKMSGPEADRIMTTALPYDKFLTSENDRVKTAFERANKKYEQPTQQQIYEELVSSGLRDERIAQELGVRIEQLPKRNRLGLDQQPTTTTGVSQPAGTKPGYDAGGRPIPIPGERKEAYELRKKDYEDEQKLRVKGREKITTESAEVVAQSQDLENLRADMRSAIGLLDTGKHNVGSIVSGVVGRGPIAQAIGSQFETEDSQNTAQIMDTVNKAATDGLKTLGSNPSSADLEFWTKNKPNSQSSPDYVKRWLANAEKKIGSKIKYAESQVTSGGAARAAQGPTITNW